MRRPSTISLFIALLVLLFTYTGLSKLLERETFAFTLSRSPLLQTIAPFLSWALPISELLLVILLIIPALQIWGLRLSLLLLTLMTLYLIYMIFYSNDLPCSCGGVLAKMSWGQHIFFNLGFIVLTGYCLLFRKKRLPVQNHSPPN